MSSPIRDIIDCKYITNVGLFLNCDESKVITYNTNSVINDYNKIKYRDGVVIAVKIDQLRGFLHHMKSITCKFIIATFDCDYSMPFEIISPEEFYPIIENPLLIHWYSVNALDCIHEKFSGIPLGMNYIIIDMICKGKFTVISSVKRRCTIFGSYVITSPIVKWFDKMHSIVFS
jgi:hypothetical protein